MTTHEAAKRAILAGPARALNLLERVPRRFRTRGWAVDDRAHIATAALCCVALGIEKQMWKVPPANNDAECWKSITPRATAGQIVAALELEDLLKLEQVTRGGRQ